MFVLIHDIFLRNYQKKDYLGVLEQPINRFIFIVYCSNLNNKARYTATQVACRWAGAGDNKSSKDRTWSMVPVALLGVFR